MKRYGKIAIILGVSATLLLATGCGSTDSGTASEVSTATGNTVAESTQQGGAAEQQAPQGNNGDNFDPSNFDPSQMPGGNFGNFGGFGGGNFSQNMITGTVKAISDTELTVTGSDGAETTYTITENTTFTKMGAGSSNFGGWSGGNGERPSSDERPSGGAEGEAPSMPEGGNFDGGNFDASQMPSGGSFDGGNFDASQMPNGGNFSQFAGESISISDIAVGDAVMISLAGDGSAATVSLVSVDVPHPEATES